MMTTDITTVKQLSFSDLYLGHPVLDDRFSDVPGAAANPLPATALLRDDLDCLTTVCRNMMRIAPSGSGFKVEYDGIFYRVSVMHTLSGEVFVLRRIADTISSLAELGVPQAYIRHLMTKELSGLFIVSGAIKTGKTSTACAMIKERLNAYGGIAVTAEDPVELPLEGNYGAGVCYQTPINREKHNFTDAFRHIMRWGAGIILIDEIRDQEVAAEVLQASINGHLVISTMLAENVIQTITKLHALSSEKLGSGSAKSLLADGLVGVLHQQLDRGLRKKLKTEFLFLKDATLTKAILRNGKYEMLEEDIRHQMAAMIAENAVAQRHGAG